MGRKTVFSIALAQRRGAHSADRGRRTRSAQRCLADLALVEPSRLDLGKKHGRHDNSTRRDGSQEGAPRAREHIPERAEARRRFRLPGSPGKSSAARYASA